MSDPIKLSSSRGRRLATHWLESFERSWERYWPDSDKSAKRKSKYDGLTALVEELTPFPPCEKDKDFLVEAYKKHSTELAAIEDRLNRLLLIILGVFGAGATVIPNARLGTVASGLLVVMVLVFVGFGLHYSFEMRQVRAAVRYLLVRCEIDMGFYIPKDRKDLPGADKQALYTREELKYPTKGKFLSGTCVTAIVVTAIVLIVLICHACSPVVPTKQSDTLPGAVYVGVLHASVCDRDL